MFVGCVRSTFVSFMASARPQSRQSRTAGGRLLYGMAATCAGLFRRSSAILARDPTPVGHLGQAPLLLAERNGPRATARLAAPRERDGRPLEDGHLGVDEAGSPAQNAGRR